MTTLLVFSIVLLAAVLVSNRANRTVLSTSVLFLVAGFVCGRGVLGVIDVSADGPQVSTLAELALVAQKSRYRCSSGEIALGLGLGVVVAMGAALTRSSLTRRDWIAASWFGPKGFASLLYGLLILNSGATNSSALFHLVALVVFASILMHSSTDVIMARWLTNEHTRTATGVPESGDDLEEDPALDEPQMPTD